MRSLVLGIVCFSGLIPAYSQNILPSDTDLKTAYCMGVLESQIAAVEAVVKDNPQSRELAKEWLREPNANLHRLRSYLVPRTSQLDLTGLVAAKNRGVIDYTASQKQTMMCLEKCPLEKSATPQALEKWNQCVQGCGTDDPAAAREQSCKNINWLPF